MRGYGLHIETNYLNEDSNLVMSLEIKAKSGRKLLREIELKLNGTYLIEPLEPTKLKNRGKKCIITRLPSLYDYDQKVHVIYLDTNRKGKVEMGDLIETR